MSSSGSYLYSDCYLSKTLHNTLCITFSKCGSIGGRNPKNCLIAFQKTLIPIGSATWRPYQSPNRLLGENKRNAKIASRYNRSFKLACDTSIHRLSTFRRRDSLGFNWEIGTMNEIKINIIKIWIFVSSISLLTDSFYCWINRAEVIRILRNFNWWDNDKYKNWWCGHKISSKCPWRRNRPVKLLIVE